MLTSDLPSRRGYLSYSQCPENRTRSKQPVFLIDPGTHPRSVQFLSNNHNWS